MTWPDRTQIRSDLLWPTCSREELLPCLWRGSGAATNRDRLCAGVPFVRITQLPGVLRLVAIAEIPPAEPEGIRDTHAGPRPLTPRSASSPTPVGNPTAENQR